MRSLYRDRYIHMCIWPAIHNDCVLWLYVRYTRISHTQSQRSGKRKKQQQRRQRQQPRRSRRLNERTKQKNIYNQSSRAPELTHVLVFSVGAMPYAIVFCVSLGLLEFALKKCVFFFGCLRMRAHVRSSMHVCMCVYVLLFIHWMCGSQYSIFIDASFAFAFD